MSEAELSTTGRSFFVGVKSREMIRCMVKMRRKKRTSVAEV